MFPRDMVCLRNMTVDTLHKGDTKDDDDDNDDDDDDNNNNNNKLNLVTLLLDINNMTNQGQALLKGTIKLQHVNNPVQKTQSIYEIACKQLQPVTSKVKR